MNTVAGFHNVKEVLKQSITEKLKEREGGHRDTEEVNDVNLFYKILSKIPPPVLFLLLSSPYVF